MNERGGYDFNHIEDAHSQSDKPAPKVSSQQSGWAKGKWVKEQAWLDNSSPPQVLHDAETELARRIATATGPVQPEQ
jgi:hypothetical protein